MRWLGLSLRGGDNMIVEDYSEHIDDFSDYIREKLTSISNLTANNDSTLFRKVLYVSFLDSLAATIYPERGNKERFVALIDRFSHWKERDNVSLTYLGRMVTLTSDPELETVRIFTKERLQEWKRRTHRDILISEDPSYKEIEKMGWGKSTKIKLDDFKHSHLIYKLRNSLVHQFQAKNELGSNIPDKPFYQVVQSLELDGSTKPIRIELIYPVAFLETISNKILDNVIEYLKKGNINPFPHYYAGDYMLEKLK